MLLFAPIAIPIIAGCLIFAIRFESMRARSIYVETVVIINSALALYVLYGHYGETLSLFSLGEKLPLMLKIDGMGVFFGSIVALLWPLASLYAFEYMRHEERCNTFFAFYTITCGVTLGVAFSGNIITMYLFYEALTLVTLPLVMHYLTKEANRATREYLYYMIGGTAFAFIGIVFYSIFCEKMEFIYGGSLNVAAGGLNPNLALFIYVLMFFGFGVKAAIWPFQRWLPDVSVAPTPVTALLHAVAVVKSGVFAVMRVTYFCFDFSFLHGTWAQALVLTAAMLSIVVASTMGVKEPHFKRRLAYSTASNLSYILLGAAVMSPLGLFGALAHMLFHAIMKISAFFCAGAVMHQTGKEYIEELDGLGHRMPVTFGAFTIAACSLVGFPLFAGFVSKWELARALVADAGILGYAGIAVLLYSALMTGIYLFTIVGRAWFPDGGHLRLKLEGISDPNWMMKLPLAIFSVVTIFLGVHAGWILEILQKIAEGVL